MLRKLNFTERVTIPRGAVHIALRRESDGSLAFDARIDLGGIAVPADARVFLEALYRNSYMRFDCGRAGDVAAPADRRLTEIDSDSVVRFRVKVVDEAGGQHRIVAAADDIVITAAAGRGGRISILPVNFRDLGDVPWRVEIDSGGAVLELNNRIDGIERMATSDASFFALVYPAAVREILTHVLVVEPCDPDEESDEWWAHWLRWARDFADVPPPVESDDRRAWIDDVVAAFCGRHRVVEMLAGRDAVEGA